MKSNEKLWDICMDIYNQMYKEANPSANLGSLIDQGITKKPDWFLDYYLSTIRQEEIITQYCTKNKLNKYECKKIYGTIMLGSSPRGDPYL